MVPRRWMLLAMVWLPLVALGPGCSTMGLVPEPGYEELDRSVDAVSAGLTSLRLCLTQPWPMLVWGATITVLVVLALLPGFLGLLIVGPVLGHASWHAYRGAVGEAPPRAPEATVT